jgi:hypothetical protein
MTRFENVGVFIREKVWLETNLFPYKYSNILKPSHPPYLSAYKDETECSETSAYKIQTPGNFPEESIQQG